MLLALAFVKPFWKPLAAILLILALWFAASRWIDGVKDAAYREGEVASEARHKLALDAENKRNREREQELAHDLTEYAERFANLTADRHQREAVIVTKIDERIAAQPDCEIDPELIRLRNEVRAQ